MLNYLLYSSTDAAPQFLQKLTPFISVTSWVLLIQLSYEAEQMFCLLLISNHCDFIQWIKTNYIYLTRPRYKIK